MSDDEVSPIEKVFRTFQAGDYEEGLSLAEKVGGECWYNGWNALACALATGAELPVIMRLLVINPDAAKKRDSQGRTALHMAIYNGHPAATILAVLNANPGAAAVKDNNGYLPIFIWVHCYADMNVYYALHTAYPGAASAQDTHGSTLLHHASLMGPKITEAVLIDNPEAAMVKNNAGYLPLHTFCKDANGCFPGAYDVFQLLYNAYPEAVFHEIEDTKESAIHLATRNHLLAADIIAPLIAANPSAAKKKYKGLREAPIDTARAHLGIVGVF